MYLEAAAGAPRGYIMPPSTLPAARFLPAPLTSPSLPFSHARFPQTTMRRRGDMDEPSVESFAAPDMRALFCALLALRAACATLFAAHSYLSALPGCPTHCFRHANRAVAAGRRLVREASPFMLRHMVLHIAAPDYHSR